MPSVQCLNRRKRRSLFKVRKSPSCTVPNITRIDFPTKSETIVTTTNVKSPFVERNIGDHVREESKMLSGAELMEPIREKKRKEKSPSQIECGHGDNISEPRTLSTDEIFQAFGFKPKEVSKPINRSMQLPTDFDPRDLFSNSANRVPCNSDEESVN